MKLGGWPVMKAETARRKAQEMLGFRATGGDPVQERREAKRQEAATVGRALDEYHAQRERRGLVKVKQERVALAAALAPWRGRDLADIDRRAIVESLKGIADDPKRGPGASAHTRKTLRTFLDWSVSEGLIPANPIAGMRQPRASRAELLQKRRSAGRALSEAEPRHIWSGLDFDRVYDRLVGFVLLTGVRRSEAAALEWSWIDDSAGVIRHVVEWVSVEYDNTLLNKWRKDLSKDEKEMMRRIGDKKRSGGDLTPAEQVFLKSIDVTASLQSMR